MLIQYPTHDDLTRARAEDPHGMQSNLEIERELTLAAIQAAASHAETFEELREVFIAYMEWK